MLTKEDLNLDEIFAPDVLWDLKPDRLPGEVARILSNGKTGFKLKIDAGDL